KEGEDGGEEDHGPPDGSGKAGAGGGAGVTVVLVRPFQGGDKAGGVKGGMARKKENSVAALRLSPETSPVTMVAPAREIPGTRDSTCPSPTAIACPSVMSSAAPTPPRRSGPSSRRISTPPTMRLGATGPAGKRGSSRHRCGRS